MIGSSAVRGSLRKKVRKMRACGRILHRPGIPSGKRIGKAVLRSDLPPCGDPCGKRCGKSGLRPDPSSSGAEHERGEAPAVSYRSAICREAGMQVKNSRNTNQSYKSAMPSERLEIEGAGNGQNKKTGNGRDERPETAGTQKPEPVGTKGRKRPERKSRNRSGRKAGNGQNKKTGNGRNKRPETAGQTAGRQPKRGPAAKRIEKL